MGIQWLLYLIGHDGTCSKVCMRSIMRSVLCLAILCGLAPAAPAALQQASGNSQPIPAAVARRVENILSQMTAAEKIKIMSGTEDEMHVPGIPRLGIPSLQESDASLGIANPLGVMRPTSSFATPGLGCNSSASNRK